MTDGLPDPLSLFLEQAGKQPDHPAVVETDAAVSYGQLMDMVVRMAAVIEATGDHPKVLIHLPQGAAAYAAMFATLMAGGYYAPTNISAPVERQNMVVDRFAPDIIISTGTLANDLQVISKDTPTLLIENIPDDHFSSTRTAHDLAYVMFTSGSTGVPKGVIIPRSALGHYVAWAIDSMQVTPLDRWSQHPNIGFDLSVLDIFAALCAGATLYPVTGRRDRLLPGSFIARHGLTVWNSVPSVIDLMVRGRTATPENLASLRLITFCGEPLLQSHLETIFECRPDLLVHNTYGPTEATVSFTLLTLTQDNYRQACGSNVALGDAIPGMALHLVGGDTAQEGEILITGPQLARGYWQDADQTAASFVQHKVDGEICAAYKTGDWGIREGNQVYFASRMDRQIKINGNRLELGEVDAALRACGAPAVSTVFWKGELHSFIENGSEDQFGNLRTALSERLPTYGIPSAFHTINSLPRNTNDKIDAQVLLEILEERFGA
jgi:D-alanine--poly(phosphoribitol) ligase subunit 1